MQEADYWLRLEHRVSREFPGMADKRLQHFWCDGFTPRQYFLDDPNPRIVGHAWIVEVQRQQEWEFTLFLGRTFPSQEAIDWPAMLPPEDVTRWVALDIDGNRIQMEPAAAVPDFEPLKKRNAKNRGSADSQRGRQTLPPEEARRVPLARLGLRRAPPVAN